MIRAYLIACLTFLALGSVSAKTSVFETIDEDDARLISALLAPRVEQRLVPSRPLVIRADILAPGASMIGDALAARLRQHGFSAVSVPGKNEEGGINLTVMALPNGLWLRVMVHDKLLFLFMNRDGTGHYQVFKQSGE
jgi:hypothetical protein